jgi:hypothetical protein
LVKVFATVIFRIFMGDSPPPVRVRRGFHRRIQRGFVKVFATVIFRIFITEHLPP